MKKLSMLVVIVVVLTLIIAGCGSTAPASPAPSKSPEAVLRAITEALNNKDAEAATALVANDVTQTLIPAPSGTGIYQGKDAMHARFKEVVAGNPIHKLTGCQTRGDKVTCAATYSDDSTKPLGFDLEFNVEAVVQNGLLKTVTWKMTDQSLAKLQAAMAPPPTAALPTASSAVKGKKPETVLRAITDALNKKDVEAATAFLADDVTQTLIPAPSGTGIYQGKDALRARFKEVAAANPVHQLTACQTNGDKVTCRATYSDDSTKSLGFNLEFNVEAVVQNGLLKAVTWKMTDQSLAKLQAAMAPQPAPTYAAPVLASSVNDIIGVWHFSCSINDVHVEYKVDGTSVFTLALPSTPGIVPVTFQNKYTFDSGTIKWTGPCTGSDPAKSCKAVYKIYVIKQGSKIAQIKYELISDEDKGGSRSCIPGKIAARAEP